MTKEFPRTEPAWALRAYLSLIGMAARRETATYAQIDYKMKRGGAEWSAASLVHLMRWCDKNDLPALTALIVDQSTGLPAAGLAAVDADKLPAAQQDVFRHDWFRHLPPTIEELADS
jgi:hypothetical protein